MKRDESFFLGDIIESIEAIEEFSKGLTKEELMSNRLKRDAIVRNVEIIGEAVKNISKNIKEKYPKVECRKIAGIRDVMIHAYFGIDMEKVWNVIKEDLPKLKKQIQNIKKEMQ